MDLTYLSQIAILVIVTVKVSWMNINAGIYVYVFQKHVRRSQHARKETEFLRLKRTRLGLDDFESLKVIGRGAFGEVIMIMSSDDTLMNLCVCVCVCYTVNKCVSAVCRCVWSRRKTRDMSTPWRSFAKPTCCRKSRWRLTDQMITSFSRPQVK